MKFLIKLYGYDSIIICFNIVFFLICFNRTPLHSASERGDFQALNILLAHPKIDVNITDEI